jgi:hypothetical protein
MLHFRFHFHILPKVPRPHRPWQPRPLNPSNRHRRRHDKHSLLAIATDRHFMTAFCFFYFGILLMMPSSRHFYLYLCL